MAGTGRVQARKRFGQHFLHDATVVERIIQVIDPQPTDHFIEIGPGTGALSLPLLARGARLDAIEIDRDLANGLARVRERYPQRFRLHVGDALRFDYVAAAGDGPLRLVGNLPYNISTPLLFRLLGASASVRDMHFMLQREVVARLVATPGGRDYGRLTVAVAARARAVTLFEVGPEAFDPPPKVWSAIVRITPSRPIFAVPSLEAFDRVVTTAFTLRRKTLANALARLLTVEQIRAAGIDPGLRPERVDPAGFARLAASLPAAGDDRP
ncbi:MAG TPA: 16S rRNA (adenine(1518)-N(6)/adenine(1519)-N(6))-dimethyltransferase RsmA [Nevskiaceae bacterium]